MRFASLLLLLCVGVVEAFALHTQSTSRFDLDIKGAQTNDERYKIMSFSPS